MINHIHVAQRCIAVCAAAALRGPLLFSFLLAMATGGWLAASQPLFAATDEAAHYDVPAQFAHGVNPNRLRTAIRQETVDALARTSIFRFDLPDPPPDIRSAKFEPPPDYLTGSTRALWVRRHLWQFSYEAIQPPLYYALVTPVWVLADELGGPVSAAYALRAVNVLFFALLAPLAVLLFRELWPTQRTAALCAGVLVALLPGLALDSTTITNDTLAAVLGGACLWQTLRAVRTGWTGRRALLIGFCFAAAIVTKPNAVGLGLGIVVALMSRGRGELGGIRRLVLWIAVAVPCAVAVGLWMVLNLRAYGSFTSYSAGRALSTDDLSQAKPLFGDLIANLRNAGRTFVIGEPLSATAPASGDVLLLVTVAACIALAGLCTAALLRRGATSRMDRFASIAVLAAVLGEIVVGLGLPGFSHATYLTPGRYLYPACTGVAALFVAGIWTAATPRVARVGVIGALAIVFLALIAAYPARLTRSVAHGTASPPTGDVVMAVNNSAAGFSGLNVRVDMVASDATGPWVHVLAVYYGLREAEWNPMPTVRSGDDVIGGGDASRSSVFAEHLVNGQATSGWIRLESGSSDVRLPDRGWSLSFDEVATDNYRHVGNVAVTVATSR